MDMDTDITITFGYSEVSLEIYFLDRNSDIVYLKVKRIYGCYERL